jgi:hypothetical protein
VGIYAYRVRGRGGRSFHVDPLAHARARAAAFGGDDLQNDATDEAEERAGGVSVV